MDNKILQAIAECVLSQLVGEGRWYKHEERRRFAEIDNPLMGLSVGDVVFTYNSDAEEIQEKRVVAVSMELDMLLITTEFTALVSMQFRTDATARQ